MDTDLFVAFLEHFSNFVEDNAIKKPVLLFVDGHSTHMSKNAAEFCATNGIILYCLLQNETHILQPCDVGFFSPMKSAWKKSVKMWQVENIGESLTKKDFPRVFKKAWESVANLEIAVRGFRRAGLFPLTSDGIDHDKLQPSKVANPDRFVTKCSSASLSSACEMLPSAIEIDSSTDQVLSSACTVPTCAAGVLPSTDVLSPTAEVPLSCAVIPSFINVVSPSTGEVPPPNADVLPSTVVPTPTAVVPSSTHDPLTTAEVPSSTPEILSSAAETILSSAKVPLSAVESLSATDKLPSFSKKSSSVQNVLPSILAAPTCMHVPSLPSSSKTNKDVSPAFDLLKLPEPKTKKRAISINQKLPKALSGSVALKMFEEREQKKADELLRKQRRKEELQKKRQEKTELAEKKKLEREKRKQRNMKGKVPLKRRRQRKLSSSSEEESSKVVYMESDESDYDERKICPGCHTDDALEDPDEWIRCCKCTQIWHVSCTGDAILLEVSVDQLKNYPFHCEDCV